MEPECVADRIVTANPYSLNVDLPWLVGNNEKEGLTVLARKLKIHLCKCIRNAVRLVVVKFKTAPFR